MEVSIPYALSAEITHRCPLHCPYCSNPLELQKRENELTTADWIRVLEEASELGIVQVHFTGGEPLLRADLEQLVHRARELGFFVNVITSGVGVTEKRVRQLIEAGVDSIQLSVQASTPELADSIAGYKAHEIKRQAAQIIRAGGLALHMNVVLHRQNIHLVEEMVELCASWGAQRLELANTQYYGWALLNRKQLLPTKNQLMVAEEAYMRAKESFGNKMELLWIVPDYYEDFPKPCMGGWGKLSLTVTPDGRVLPCTAAASITTFHFESVLDRNLTRIWQESVSFNAFRGFDWMAEPCKSCDRRFQDFGGCRCQAFLLTGDARQTDPVCQWSPHRGLITEFVSSINGGDIEQDSDLEKLSPSYSYRGR
ncbi:pyrroloquinoline quinone biosynthesis protein PqqE [Cohnella endophytica]|uniref:PqqA peptide cyclase n=1 Tax=Cohnella endophytica TaxID=2419778 RepID=A0A494XK43_9BACL|nr:pyrroloquinoline quinone biosynthesis protein PqqE [Cohnella endophytica]RKP47923.1 pyrroloquinoline quinone biosynthesis protein PqqE [Cohnella endophytica]